MRFCSLTTLSSVLALNLAGLSSAYVVKVYQQNGCQGQARLVNVWDNTCANWMDSFLSFELTSFGGQNQIGLFYSEENCDSATIYVRQMMDGGENSLETGKCWDFSGPIQAVQSSDIQAPIRPDAPFRGRRRS